MSEVARIAWTRVGAHLRAALAEAKLDPSEAREVERYLERNELGLAFQAMVASLARTDGYLRPDIRAQLAGVAFELGLEDDSDWRRLEGLHPAQRVRARRAL